MTESQHQIYEAFLKDALHKLEMNKTYGDSMEKNQAYVMINYLRKIC